MSDELKLCIPQVPDVVDLETAERVAVAENPQNRSNPLEIAGVTRKFWRPGRTLRCRFMEGDPIVHVKVAAVAHKWSEFANIKFDFGDHADAEIRISFAKTGSWSTVGTDALLRDPDQATMNYGWLDAASNDEDYNRVVLHEFGHALGMIHEHQHPQAGFQWDRAAVINYYSGPPNNWPVWKIEHNVLNRFSVTTTQFTAFDERSIMLYPIPNSHTVGDFEVNWRNAELSTSDKAFAGQVYPHDVLPFDAAVLAPNNKLYLFQGSNYVRVTPGVGQDNGYPKPIEGNWGDWPDEFLAGVDAAMAYTDNKLYFFKGSQVLRYTMGQGVDDGYPKQISDEWSSIRF